MADRAAMAHRVVQQAGVPMVVPVAVVWATRAVMAEVLTVTTMVGMIVDAE